MSLPLHPEKMKVFAPKPETRHRQDKNRMQSIMIFTAVSLRQKNEIVSGWALALYQSQEQCDVSPSSRVL
jgi:hypothetical protein